MVTVHWSHIMTRTKRARLQLHQFDYMQMCHFDLSCRFNSKILSILSLNFEESPIYDSFRFLNWWAVLIFTAKSTPITNSLRLDGVFCRCGSGRKKLLFEVYSFTLNAINFAEIKVFEMKTQLKMHEVGSNFTDRLLVNSYFNAELGLKYLYENKYNFN